MPNAKNGARRKFIPFDFVLEELASLAPVTRPLFGCTSVYVGEKIVLALRKKEVGTADNGVWIATTPEHHASLKRDLPSMRSISLFGPGPSGWQVLPEESPDFMDDVQRVCELILRGDLRVGKIPQPKRKSVRQVAAGSRPDQSRKRRKP